MPAVPVPLPPSPGEEPPRKPEHSLPLYSETTLERVINRNQSREDVAERDLKGTAFSPGARSLLIALFLLTIALPASIQLLAEFRAGHRLLTFDLIRALPKWSRIHAARNPADFWNLTPQADDIKAYEKGMERGSVISQWLLPHVQNILTFLGAGNEQAYPGRPGWLFYRPDVEYSMGPPFLDSALLAKRQRAAGVVPDPIAAIVGFRDGLAARGIELVVFPAPVKPVVDGEMLAASVIPGMALQNASFYEFVSRLRAHGVWVFDPTSLLMARKEAQKNGPLYLESDTHWTPDTMRFVAFQLRGFLQRVGLEPVGESPPGMDRYSIVEKPIAALGDIALMLKLPMDQKVYRPQTVMIQQVSIGNAPWRATPGADILLLGDSFSNVYSLGGMGWGESAGFAEHLSRALGKPLDTILRNSDGAWATRDMLSRELARGRDRLAGKKYVVWEFAARELSIGNWKLLPLKLGTPPESHFYNSQAGTEITVTGTVQTVSPVPWPGSVPYKDHILSVHLTDLTLEDQPPGAVPGSLQALVYLWSMRDNVWTPAAHVRPGDQITVRLRAWSDVSPEYEKTNRSELDDPDAQLEEPVWGEWVR